ncbi:ferritin family protein [Candidatus Omnitrophota bacterium]
MDKIIQELLDEAIRLESNVADLYFLYSKIFRDDREFWLKIADEEMRHASLLRVVTDFVDFGSYIHDIIYANLGELKQVNKDIKEKITQFKKESPSMEVAYKYAIALENGAYELHYQKLVTGTPNTQTLEALQRLTGDDKDHADRITKLLKEK